MDFYILTLFPDMVRQGLSTSIIGRAAERGLISVEAVDIRDYTKDRHRKVDDYPYGGGAGMLMQAQPVYDAWKSVSDKLGRKPRTVYLTPQGGVFTQQKAKELAAEEELVLLCGHYEGIDERVLEEIVTDYVSIGDYVLTGGELAAMVVADAVSRMVPGVLTNGESGMTESFEGELLEYPQYSRPEEWMGKRVPEVLLSGNQKKIKEWRLRQSEERTKRRRPDLYQKYKKLQACREAFMKQKLLHMDMIELIARGQAGLVYAEGNNICLRQPETGFYFLTAEDREGGTRMLDALADAGEEMEIVVLHQEFMVEPTRERYGLQGVMPCAQAVYTRKEKLPIRGLYRADGGYEEGKPQIRRLDENDLDTAARYYAETDSAIEKTRAYLKERMEKGWLFGAFLGEELAGFVGMHAEGSIGMLTVLPEYRRKGIGKALETYAVNALLEHGYTPYGQVKQGNEASLRLQEALGLCVAKQMVYWLEKN